MPPRHSKRKIIVQHVILNRRHPAVCLTDLATMLEIDLVIGQRRVFERRLSHALDSAYRQGRESLTRH